MSSVTPPTEPPDASGVPAAPEAPSAPSAPDSPGAAAALSTGGARNPVDHRDRVDLLADIRKGVRLNPIPKDATIKESPEKANDELASMVSRVKSDHPGLQEMLARRYAVQPNDDDDWDDNSEVANAPGSTAASAAKADETTEVAAAASAAKDISASAGASKLAPAPAVVPAPPAVAKSEAPSGAPQAPAAPVAPEAPIKIKKVESAKATSPTVAAVPVAAKTPQEATQTVASASKTAAGVSAVKSAVSTASTIASAAAANGKPITLLSAVVAAPGSKHTPAATSTGVPQDLVGGKNASGQSTPNLAATQAPAITTQQPASANTDADGSSFAAQLTNLNKQTNSLSRPGGGTPRAAVSQNILIAQATATAASKGASVNSTGFDKTEYDKLAQKSEQEFLHKKRAGAYKQEYAVNSAEHIYKEEGKKKGGFFQIQSGDSTMTRKFVEDAKNGPQVEVKISAQSSEEQIADYLSINKDFATPLVMSESNYPMFKKLVQAAILANMNIDQSSPECTIKFCEADKSRLENDKSPNATQFKEKFGNALGLDKPAPTPDVALRSSPKN